MKYKIYKNIDGHLALLVYPVSGNYALEFENLQDAVDHVNRLSKNAQYVLLDKNKKIVYVTGV